MDDVNWAIITYANGAVVNLQIAPGKVTALVSGSEIYSVDIQIESLKGPRWSALLKAAETAQLDLERILQRQAGSHPNYREGVQAFLQKRKPSFSGKR